MGALIGACAAVAGGMLFEHCKRHRDRKRVASALADEISAIVSMTTARNYVPLFQSIAAQIEAGTNVAVPLLIGEPREMEPMMEKHIDRLGLLGGDLSERIVTFYSFVQGIKLDIDRMANGEFDDDLRAKAFLVRQDVALWKDADTVANAVLAELRAIAASRSLLSKAP